MWRRSVRPWRRTGGRLAALAALCAILACVRVPAPPRAQRRAFPRAHAATVAHLLADFSTHAHSARGWRLEEERGNYTEWSYRVSFACGARCVGAARVHASTAARTHGLARAHTVRLQLGACSRPPLLPRPQLCDEAEVEWRVWSDADGAGCVVEERARAWCGALRVLTGACARGLPALDRVAALLDPRPAPTTT